MTHELEWTSLAIGDYGLYQEKRGWRFSIDAIMLSHFAKVLPNETLLDIGTGNGIIPHLMTIDEPLARYIGVDIEPTVIALANKSKKRNAFSDERLSFFVKDIRVRDKAWHAYFDHITSNPPFFKITHGKISPDKRIARARHEITLNAEELFKAAYFYLKPRGSLWLVHRSERIDELFSLGLANRLKPAELRLVYANQKAKTSKLALLRFIKDGQNSLKILAPLYEFDEDGNYNEELNTWYGRIV